LNFKALITSVFAVSIVIPCNVAEAAKFTKKEKHEARLAQKTKIKRLGTLKTALKTTTVVSGGACGVSLVGAAGGTVISAVSFLFGLVALGIGLTLKKDQIDKNDFAQEGARGIAGTIGGMLTTLNCLRWALYTGTAATISFCGLLITDHFHNKAMNEKASE
jgi:hypothetical protein